MTPWEQDPFTSSGVKQWHLGEAQLSLREIRCLVSLLTLSHQLAKYLATGFLNLWGSGLLLFQIQLPKCILNSFLSKGPCDSVYPGNQGSVSVWLTNRVRKMTLCPPESPGIRLIRTSQRRTQLWSIFFSGGSIAYWSLDSAHNWKYSIFIEQKHESKNE